ncbi:uncharacterized protein LOC122400460 [Colletes gigas]|uniref:uncharacterized protein LOC122400460 n=1 Tax=Colletes gigas TaxID=935657 RepID=UPI001C9A3833|nr:uncharacterized protein LOC122400460 [Colletes gigas]
MSYPKGSREISDRASKRRKRSFSGNQFTKKSDKSEEGSTSASSKKISASNVSDIPWNPLHHYRIIEWYTVFATFSQMVLCRECKQTLTFEEGAHRSLGFKLILMCRCGRRNINSGPLINTGYEVNRRIVFVMRLLGLGREGINLFCNIMDICNGLNESTYNNIIMHIHSVVTSVFERLSKKAVDQEKKVNEQNDRPIFNLKVSGDGSWKRRGFKSLYGVTTLIGYYSGEVIDFVVKSSYCQACTAWKSKQDDPCYEEWFEQHEEECAKNHTGSAGKMEVDAMKEMFLRSEEKFGVKYRNYIGDGDSKTYKAILDINPYRDDFPVSKSEFVGHVEKRMSTRLRNIIIKEKLGGKGKLTDTLIKKLTTYYGLAIRRNSHNVADMKREVMATFYHLCSTNEKPQHEHCPPGEDSWCKWQKGITTGVNMKLFEHPPPLDKEVAKFVLPIYEDLSKEDLLSRCLDGHTQNANESFNATVWRLTPKHLNSGRKIVEIAAYIAAAIFNEGYVAVLQIMAELELRVGSQSKKYAKEVDDRRLNRQGRRSYLLTNAARKARKDQLAKENEYFEDEEGVFYGPGIAN